MGGRRSLLKKTLGGAALLAAAGAVPVALRRTRLRPLPAGRALQFLTPAEYSILAAVAERIVAAAVPEALAADPPGGAPGLPEELARATAAQPPGPTAAEVRVAEKLDAFLAPLPEADGKEFKQLLALFDNALFALLGGGPPTPFTQMSAEQQDSHLARWARSRLAVQRSGYQAMKRLCATTYFASPEVYDSVGYPGPPVELVRTVNAARAAAAAGQAPGPEPSPAAAPPPPPTGDAKAPRGGAR
jgi:hypothetical protein